MCDAEKTLPHMIQKAKNAGTKKGRNIEIGEKKNCAKLIRFPGKNCFYLLFFALTK